MYRHLILLELTDFAEKSIHVIFSRTSISRGCQIGRASSFLTSLRSWPTCLHASSGILSLQPSAEPPSVSLVLSVLFGLPLVLWTYKCLALLLFQRKIIYMGYAPLGSRDETLSGVESEPKGLSYEEIQITSSNKVVLSALVMGKDSKNVSKPDCVVIYLQGNAGNPLHRIPVFTELLTSTKTISPVILAAAPRSYWRSTNRTPTQKGILADYKHVLRFAAKRWPETPLVLYGHSLGGAIAVCLLASLDSSDTNSNIIHKESTRTLSRQENKENKAETGNADADTANAISGLILENPFSSIPNMVRALYPQRWLPYRFLAPLAWDKWDALDAMRTAFFGANAQSREGVEANSTMGSDSVSTSVLARAGKDMLVLVSKRDEIVPGEMGRALYDARPRGGSAKFVVIEDALHEDAWKQKQWVREIGQYLKELVKSQGRR
ncbi:Alpha/Beta hydrolase protein [Phellopilus nigrolimitatus]|nr:Alpha/Beta hydrolase protein [Phellopilus nigrolimitatus]